MVRHSWTVALACIVSLTACHINELKYIDLHKGQDSGWRQVNGEAKTGSDKRERRVRRSTTTDPSDFDFFRDVAEVLQGPGVRAVALSLTAHWSRPSQSEQKTWKKLAETHREDGVVFVALRVQDEANRDQAMDWPDKVFWDNDGRIAEALGVSPQSKGGLPTAFLWSWTGRLDVSHRGVDAVQAKLRRLENDTPKVLVTLADEVDEADGEGLLGAVEEELEKAAKLSLVWETKEANTFNRLLAKARRLGDLGERRCNAPLTPMAKTVLVVDLQGRELVLQLEDIGERCLHHVGATRLKSGPSRTAVARAIQDLMDGISQQASPPDSR